MAANLDLLRRDMRQRRKHAQLDPQRIKFSEGERRKARVVQRGRRSRLRHRDGQRFECRHVANAAAQLLTHAQRGKHSTRLAQVGRRGLRPVRLAANGRRDRLARDL